MRVKLVSEHSFISDNGYIVLFHFQGYMYFVDDGVFGSFSEVLLAPITVFKPIPLNTVNSARPSYISCVCGQTCDGHDFVNKNCLLPKVSKSRGEGGYSL